MNVLTIKEIEFTCLQSNSNNTYLVKFLRPIPQIKRCTMYYLLLKKNQNVYRQIDIQDLILLLLIYIVQVQIQIHSYFVS